jgi:hypothetical protein
MDHRAKGARRLADSMKNIARWMINTPEDWAHRATRQLLRPRMIAVGTVIAHRPPRRPGRAQFGYPVLTLSV